jgi:hypothetical protein
LGRPPRAGGDNPRREEITTKSDHATKPPAKTDTRAGRDVGVMRPR